MNQLWVIYWSHGPHDNPVGGRVEIDADSAYQAIEKFAVAHGDHYDVDLVFRADLEKEFMPPEPTAEQKAQIINRNLVERLSRG